ncbi:MAG: hypothetical protein HY791_00775 [Deltaproteobacteria bacterium]|nr:hypothetical protein [Deltaproteobacteria bacterium]
MSRAEKVTIEPLRGIQAFTLGEASGVRKGSLGHSSARRDHGLSEPPEGNKSREHRFEVQEARKRFDKKNVKLEAKTELRARGEGR